MLKRELKTNKKSLIIWTSIVSLLLIMVFCVYPYIKTSDSLSEIDKMMEMFPKELLEAFNFDAFSISTAFGWIKTEGYVFIILLGSVYSGMLGASILSIEERDKTIEFLATKPVTRNKIVTSKIVAGMFHIFIFTLIVYLVEVIGLYLSDELELYLLTKMNVVLLLLYYMMFSISLMVSTIIKNKKSSIGIGLVVAFLPYILQLVGTLSDKVKILKQISLYEFVSLRYLIDNNHINYVYLIVGIFLIITSYFITYKIYKYKELV